MTIYTAIVEQEILDKQTKKKLTNIMIGEKKIEFIMIHTYQSYIK